MLWKLNKNGNCEFAFAPDNIQGDICVVKFSVHAVVVQRDDVVQLGHRYVHVGVVVGVQGDPAHADAVGEEQVRLRGVVTWPAVSLEQDASGTGAGRTVGTRQAQVGAAPVPPAALIKTWKGQRPKDCCREPEVHFKQNRNTDSPATEVSYCCLATAHNTVSRSYIYTSNNN